MYIPTKNYLRIKAIKLCIRGQIVNPSLQPYSSTPNPQPYSSTLLINPTPKALLLNPTP